MGGDGWNGFFSSQYRPSFRSINQGAPLVAQAREQEVISSQLTEAELAALMPSELCQYQTPIPTQIVASDEFYPDPQNERQREVEARLRAMADDLGGGRA